MNTINTTKLLQAKAEELNAAPTVSVVDLLTIVLADTYSLTLIAQNAHWNVEEDFFPLHGVFGDIYDELFGDVDEIAEQIRKLGSYAPANFALFVEKSGMVNPSAPQSCEGWIYAILAGYMKMKSDIQALQSATKSVGLLQVQNLAIDLEAKADKKIWMLKSQFKDTD